jgi:dTDP-4-amino-4,6-dideoxygalactose transaminase
MCVTEDDELALRMKLIRNHGENVVEPLGIERMENLVGFNFRMTELQAAVGIEQLKRIDGHVATRERLARALTKGIEGLAGISVPVARPGCRHVYYVWALRFHEESVGIPRALFCKALQAEGFPVFEGYVKPLYLLPLFQKRTAIGREGYPFTLVPERTYGKGLCPVAERMHEKEFIGFEPCAYDVSDEQAAGLIEGFRKVHSRVRDLQESLREL